VERVLNDTNGCGRAIEGHSARETQGGAMDWLWDVQWETLFVPDTPLLEIFVRGTIMYLGVFLILRFVMKRQVGTVGIADIIVVVFIADAAQNGMAGDYDAIPDGLLLVGVIVFWAAGIDALAHRVPAIARLAKAPPLLLVKDGVLQRHNMRREFLTEEELMSQLRLQGVEDLGRVKQAFMEPDGRVSVIEQTEQQHGRNDRRTA
jgi:uncharacterized membrane protein YcaP (DUF421 family)